MNNSFKNIWPVATISILLILLIVIVIYMIRKTKKEDKESDNRRAIITYDPQAGKKTIFDQWQYRNDSVANNTNGQDMNLFGILATVKENGK